MSKQISDHAIPSKVVVAFLESLEPLYHYALFKLKVFDGSTWILLGTSPHTSDVITTWTPAFVAYCKAKCLVITSILPVRKISGLG